MIPTHGTLCQSRTIHNRECLAARGPRNCRNLSGNCMWQKQKTSSLHPMQSRRLGTMKATTRAFKSNPSYLEPTKATTTRERLPSTMQVVLHALERSSPNNVRFYPGKVMLVRMELGTLQARRQNETCVLTEVWHSHTRVGCILPIDSFRSRRWITRKAGICGRNTSSAS